MKQLFICLITLFFTALHAATFTINGPPIQLSIESAEAGEPPQPTVDDSQEYSLFFENSNFGEIKAELHSKIPPHCSLEVELQCPSRAHSKGWVDLSDSLEHTLISHIPSGRYTGLKIKYRLSGKKNVSVIPPNLLDIEFKFNDHT